MEQFVILSKAISLAWFLWFVFFIIGLALGFALGFLWHDNILDFQEWRKTKKSRVAQN